MARIFEEAQETVRQQDRYRTRNDSRGLPLHTITNPAQAQALRVHKIQDAETLTKEFLPALQPLGRFSDDFPENIRPRPSPGQETGAKFAREKWSTVDSTHIPRANSNQDLRGCRIQNEAEDRTSPIEEWLDGIPHWSNMKADTNMFTLKSTFSDSSSSDVSSKESKPISSDSCQDSQTLHDSVQPSLVSPAQRVIASLVTPVPPKRFKIPARPMPAISTSSRMMPTRFRAMRVPSRKASRQNVGHEKSAETSSRPIELMGSGSSTRNAKNHKSERANPDVDNVTAVTENLEHDVQNNTTPKNKPISYETRDTEQARLTPLSPHVELYRKDERPRRARCPSYFDQDILPSPLASSAGKENEKPR